MFNPPRQEQRAESIELRAEFPQHLGSSVSQPSLPACPWLPIMAAYCGYAVITLVGGIAGVNLQVIGAMGFLIYVAVQYGRYIFPLPLSGLTVALGFSFLIPMVAPLTGITPWSDLNAEYWIKYAAVYFTILLAVNLNLPPLSLARVRFWGLGAILGLLVLGAIAPGGMSGERLQSVFANPNNFALAAMSLLFFVDHQRDTLKFNAAIHVIAVVFVLLSGTMGAFLGYLSGMFVYIRRTRFALALYLALISAVVLFGLFIVASRSVDPQKLERYGPVGDMMLKVCAVTDSLGDYSSDSQINYWDVGKDYGGAESTSALWRIMHWRDTLQTIWESNWLARLFGHGVGSSEAVTGRLPHNDYLRVLFEVGIFGLVANCAVWLFLYARVEPPKRWVCVMMAVYAFTENNFDNFLVMSLFVLFIVTARAVVSEDSSTPLTAEEAL